MNSNSNIAEDNTALKNNNANLPIEEDDDSDMAPQQTKLYIKVLMLTDKYVSLIKEMLGAFSSVALISNGKETIEISKLLATMVPENKIVTIDDMNACIAYILKLPYENARKFMGYIEDQQLQSELWSVTTI